MSRPSDLNAYGRRATSYDSGPRGVLHARIVSRTASLALNTVPTPRRVLDVGCGTGLLLRELVALASSVTDAIGVDPSSEMIDKATGASVGASTRFVVGSAEELPGPSDFFDLVISSTSFSHWQDQSRGLGECARVLAPGGHLVLVDVFSSKALPVRVFGPGGAAGTTERATRMLEGAGFTRLAWHPLFVSVIKGVIAEKPFPANR